MCIDNGSRPGAEAIAIIHAINSTLPSTDFNDSPMRHCRILFSNQVSSQAANQTLASSSPSTSYQHSGLSDLLPSPGRQCEVWLSSFQFCISEMSDERTWHGLPREIDLGVGEHGVMGHVVSLRCDGVEIGRGIMGWGDL